MNDAQNRAFRAQLAEADRIFDPNRPDRAFRPIPNSVEVSHRECAVDDRRVKPKPPLFLQVITAGTDPDAPPEHSHKINYNRRQSRDWLVDHMAWALNTGRTIHLAKAD